MLNRKCVLYDDKMCNECGECNYCDINPDKICDNCMMCISSGRDDYRKIQIDEIIEGYDDNEDSDCSHDHSGHHHHRE